MLVDLRHHQCLAGKYRTVLKLLIEITENDTR